LGRVIRTYVKGQMVYENNESEEFSFFEPKGELITRFNQNQNDSEQNDIDQRSSEDCREEEKI